MAPTECLINVHTYLIILCSVLWDTVALIDAMLFDDVSSIWNCISCISPRLSRILYGKILSCSVSNISHDQQWNFLQDYREA